MRKFAIAALMLGGSCMGATAQTSEDYARLAVKSYTAFECSVLSAALTQPAPNTNYFKLGIDLGNQVIEAATLNKLEKEHLKTIVPKPYAKALRAKDKSGVIGAVWNDASDAVRKRLMSVLPKGGYEVPQYKAAAAEEFKKLGCSAL